MLSSNWFDFPRSARPCLQRWSGQARWQQAVALTLGIACPLITPAVLPAPAKIIPVGYDTTDLPQLSESEQERLDILLGVQQPILLSTISPDGSTVVVATTSRLNPENRQLRFLNLHTGDLSDSLALDYEVVSPDLPIRWLNNQVLRFAQQSPFGPWEIITINRDTQIVSHTSVYPSEEEEGEVLGIAPDFSKFVVRVFEGDSDGVYVVSIPSLQRLEIARLTEGFEIQPPTWSDDGNQMVLVTSSIEERRLYDRTPTSPNLADPVIQDALGRFPADDNIFQQRNTVKIFDFSQPVPLRSDLTAVDDGADIFAQATLSGDGQRVLFKLYRPGRVTGRENATYLFPESAYYRLYDLDGNLLTQIDQPELSGPIESSGKFLGTDQILFWATSGLNRHVFRYDIATATLRPLPLPDGTVVPDTWEVTPDGQTLIYGFSSITQPPELFALPLNGGTFPRQLTTLNADVLAVNQVRFDTVTFETQTGRRQGLLIQPRNGSFPPQKIPLVMWQQGGPGFSMANEFAPEVEMPLNLLPNFGISVLSVALAGREGYGPQVYRLQADGDNFGQVDILEGVEVANQMIRQGWTSRRQLGITGCSYGGYFTSQIISRFPDLFAAANPQCSLLDTFTEWQLGYSSLLSYLVGHTPMETPDRYAQISPLYNAQRIHTPTMLFHGSDDFLQIDVARNFHDVIDENKVPVDLYEFQGMGHSLYDPEYQRMAAQLQIDFFRHYLTGSALTEPPLNESVRSEPAAHP